MGIKFTPAKVTKDGKQTFLPFQEGSRPPVQVTTSPKRENDPTESSLISRRRDWYQSISEVFDKWRRV